MASSADPTDFSEQWNDEYNDGDDENESNGGWSDTSGVSTDVEQNSRPTNARDTAQPDFAAQLRRQQMQDDYSSDGDSSGYLRSDDYDEEPQSNPPPHPDRRETFERAYSSSSGAEDSEHGFSKSTLGPSPFKQQPSRSNEDTSSPHNSNMKTVPSRRDNSQRGSRSTATYLAPAPTLNPQLGSQRCYSPGYDQQHDEPEQAPREAGVHPYQVSVRTNSDNMMENDHEKSVRVCKQSLRDISSTSTRTGGTADLENGSKYRKEFEDSMAFSEVHNRDRRTMLYMGLCLVCTLIVLFSLIGGIVGAAISRSDDNDNPSPVPAPAPVVKETTAPVATVVSTESPVAVVAATSPPTSAPSGSPVVTTTLTPSQAPVATGPTFGGGGGTPTFGGGGGTPTFGGGGGTPTFGGGGGNTPTDGDSGPTFGGGGGGTPTFGGGGGTTDPPTTDDSKGDLSFVTNRALFDAVAEASPDGGVAASTVGTPQHNAFLWLQNDSFFFRRRLQGTNTSRRQLQRYALACLYYSTGGESWTRNSGWLEPVDECQWHTDAQGQVNCDTENRIRIVQFSSNNVNGVMPPELSFLDSLVTLVMDSTNDVNGLTGGIPESYGGLKSLITCRFHGHKFTEPLPDGLFSLWSQATAVDFFNSELSGPIPSSIGGLTAVTRVVLAGNKLSGTIPTSVGELREVLTLSMEGNALNGPIPSEIGLMESITGIYLQDNQLSGNIPSEIQLLSKLKAGINLANNRLSGPIPDVFTGLSRLRAFIVNNNELTGPVPPSFASSSNMRELMLQDNNLSGAVPELTCTAINSRTTNEARVDCDEVSCTCCGC